MNNDLQIFRDRKKKNRWKKVMLALSLGVAVTTASLLILPAVTLEKEPVCGMEEHVHGVECYREENGEELLICELEEHQHTEACYPADEPAEPESGTGEETPAEPESGTGEETPMAPENGTGEETPVAPENGTGEETPVAPENGTGEEMPMVPESGTDPGMENPEELPELPEEEGALPPGGETLAEGANDPYNLVSEGNITGGRFQYKLPGESEGDWKDYQQGTPITENVDLRMEISYENVEIQSLLENHGCQVSYLLPIEFQTYFRNVTATGQVTAGDEIVGSIGLDEQTGTVIITFRETWLKGQLETSTGEGGVSTLKGSFYLGGELNLKEISKDNVIKIPITSDKEANITFGEDFYAKNAEVKIEKSVANTVKTEDNESPAYDYLEYTLKVTAGADGCPGVKVNDSFTGGMKGMEYVASSTAGNVEVTADSLTWTIGDMDPNAEATLTYRVKLPEDKKWNVELGKVSNVATVYASENEGQEHKRVSDQSEFTFTGNMDMRKDGIKTVHNDDGSWTITYCVWFEAKHNGNNNYTLRDVTITDKLSSYTNSELLKFLNYDKKSFKLYEGAISPESAQKVELKDGDLTWLDQVKGFTLKVPDMAPGKIYCFTYDVIVAKDAVAFSNLEIINMAEIFSGNAKHGSDQWLQRYKRNEKIRYDHWVKKQADQTPVEETEISFGENAQVYEFGENGTIRLESKPPESFTVPEGSYRYEVILNELGDGDIKDANLSDRFSDQDHMSFTGYLKVERCTPASVPGSSENPGTVTAGELGAVQETRWLKIDVRGAFALTLSELGFTESHDAYRFTYYARTQNMDSASTVEITNRFEIKGNVGLGAAITTPITSETTLTVQGGNSFEAEKQPWFYNSVKADQGNWKNGQLYWYIEVKGTKIAQGTRLKDQIVTDGATDSLLHSDSLQGVYVGTFPEGADSPEDLETSQTLSLLTKDEDYKVSYGSSVSSGTDNYHEMTVEMLREIMLGEDNNLYLIVRTEPESIPVKRNGATYKNGLLTSDDGEHWVSRNTVSNQLFGGGNILKESLSTFRWDGTKVTELTQNSQFNRTVVTKLLNNPGIYASWNVKINYGGSLEGDFLVTDTIPKGMELTYVRTKWKGPAAGGTTMAKIEKIPSDWEEKVVQARTDGNNNTETSYYYTKDDKVQWKVSGLKKWKKGEGYRREDDYSIDCQVVCRVTDPEVLLGGQQKDFLNHVELQTLDNVKIDESEEKASFQPEKTLNKTNVTASDKPQISYTIEVNPSGLDLNAVGDTIKLYDKMSPRLEPVPGTIRFVKISTEEEITGIPVIWDRTTGLMTMELPDNTPIKITYDTKVNAAPGEKIEIRNKVYWENYENGGETNEIRDYAYSVGGTVDTDSKPTLEIFKADAGNLAGSGLVGAEFQLTKMQQSGDTYEPTDIVYTGTTDAAGKMQFGETNQTLEFGMIYELKETEAPKGYVKDPTPQYLRFVKKDENGRYPSEVDKITVGGEAYEVTTFYSGKETLTVYNQKGLLRVNKNFKNAGGTDTAPIAGTYRFGVYTKSDTGYEPVKVGEEPLVKNLVIGQGSTEAQITFENLDLDKTYYVFELDENGKRIEGGNIFHSGDQLFQVTYEKVPGGQADGSADHGVALDPARGEGAVTVTNQAYISLPKTGGGGVLPYALTGAALFLGSAKALHKKHKKEKR